MRTLNDGDGRILIRGVFGLVGQKPHKNKQGSHDDCYPY